MPLYLVYYFWLFVISAAVFALERFFPRRREQEAIRAGFVQDLFWMVFNTQYVSWMLALLAVHVVAWFNASFLHFGIPTPDSLRLVAEWPAWVQFVVCFVVRDFLEWNIHRGLHTVPWLWRFHQLHHSIEELDWVATFRSHWGEIIIYQVLIYVPLVVLGVNDNVIFATLVVNLLIQELSHANLRWDWGPFRYIFNSPRFHAWHHAVEVHGKGGQNFGVTLAIWDWLFGTAYWPRSGESPRRFGFEGMDHYPNSVWHRLWQPFLRTPEKTPAAKPEKAVVRTDK